MTIEYAGRMKNSIHKVRIDGDERVVTVIVPRGWRVELIPAVHPGLALVEIGGPVRMPGVVDQGLLASVPSARSFFIPED